MSDPTRQLKKSPKSSNAISHEIRIRSNQRLQESIEIILFRKLTLYQ